MEISWSSVVHHEIPITEGKRLHEDILADPERKMGKVSAGVTPDGELVLVFCGRKREHADALGRVCNRQALRFQGGTYYMLYPNQEFINIVGIASTTLEEGLTPEMERLALEWLYQQLGWEMPADQAQR